MKKLHGTENDLNLCNTKKFKSRRTRSRCWFLTWHIEDDNSLTQKIELLKKLEGIERYVFQLEKTRDEGLHFQGVFRYGNPRESWPYLCDKRAHWERCRSWPAGKKYCVKLKSRVAGPWTNEKGLRYRKMIKDPMKGKKPYEWQQEILELIKTEPDDRKIYWYWDLIGCTGKTCLAKHIKMNNEGCIVNHGKCKDIMYNLNTYLDKGIDVDIVIFNLTRSDENKVSYQAIEMIKDGLGFSGKYESTEILMNPPHIIVFANYEPDRMKLSIDRWVVKMI